MCQKSPNSPSCSPDVNLKLFRTSYFVTSNYPPAPPPPTHIIRPSYGELRKCFGLQIWSHQIPLLSTRIGLSHGELPETSQSRLCLVTATIAIIERDHLLDDYFSRFSFISTSTQVPMSLACNT